MPYVIGTHIIFLNEKGKKNHHHRIFLSELLKNKALHAQSPQARRVHPDGRPCGAARPRLHRDSHHFVQTTRSVSNGRAAQNDAVTAHKARVQIQADLLNDPQPA